METADVLPDLDEALMAVGSPASDTPDEVVVEVARTAISELLEKSMVGRAAEALRRLRAEKLMIGVATSDQAFRTVTLRNQGSCSCYTTATKNLAVDPPSRSR